MHYEDENGMDHVHLEMRVWLLDYIELKCERFSCALNCLLKYEAWMSQNTWYSSGYDGLISSTFLLDLSPSFLCFCL